MRIVCSESVTAGERLFSQFGDVQVLSDSEINAQTLQTTDILVTRSTVKVNADLLQQCALKIIATATAGVDHIDRTVAAAKGITVLSAAGSNAVSVAEYVVHALLMLANKFNMPLSQRTLGIIGYGAVGKQVASFAKALGLVVIANDPPLEAAGIKGLVSLEQLQQQADIISIHCPLHTEDQWSTRHLCDAKFFSRLEQCIVMNTSRGSIIDTTALLNAIAQRNVDHAVIDVWENEPDISKELLSQASIATPHIAGYSYTARLRSSYQIYQQLCERLQAPIEVMWEQLQPKAPETIVIDNAKMSLEQALWQVLQEAYNLQADDLSLRALASLDKNTMAGEFKRLRREYPRRYEHSQYCVRLKHEDEMLKKCLIGLGFS